MLLTFVSLTDLGIILSTLLLTNEFVVGKYSAYDYENAYNLHYGKSPQKGNDFNL